MPIYEINDLKPRIGDGTWVAPSADIIGDVTIGKNCYIGFGAVIRADFGPIIIGSESLIEDSVVVHTATRTQIGNRVIVGHMAMIHDAVIRDRALIGMKAMICEGAVIGADAIVAEQALVRKNQEIPPAKIYGGAPAEFIKEATKKHQEMLGEGIAAYMDLLKLYKRTFKEP
jgi:carbonic anhydrase/acetyltransferase-like protein (isoleucine patch superfamily)